MYNGDIVKIDSDLNTETYPLDLSYLSKNATHVTYQKNVRLDKNKILVNLEINEVDKKTKLLAKISFENKVPKVDIVRSNLEEKILNMDNEKTEVYTRSYVSDKTVITVRDTKTLKVKNEILLNNNDPIYFVDKIGQ